MIEPTIKAIPLPESALPEHLAWLSMGEWAVWRWVALRGTGFPADLLLRLGDAEASAAADGLFAAEERLQQHMAEAGRQIEERLVDARRRSALESFARSRGLNKALRLLRKQRTGPAVEEALGREAAAGLEEALAAVEIARAALETAYEAAAQRQGTAIDEVAASPQFREAVLWQNRHAYQTGIQRLARLESRNAERRSAEELVARYLQRYTVKNDTIGFFGPVAWARIEDAGPPIEVRPGPGLLSGRRVYLEAWCLQQIAHRLAQMAELQPWLRPRAVRGLRVEGSQAHRPDGSEVRLAPASEALVRLCDGRRTVREIAGTLSKEISLMLRSEADGIRLIEQLVEQGVLEWGLHVPHSLFPEQLLRRQLETVADEGARRAALTVVGEIEAARDEVARAAGDVDRLDRALQHLNSRFTELTSTAAVRREGETYGGRTLAYEDCRRDVQVSLGPGLVEEMGRPLSLILQSARWYTQEMRRSVLRIARGIYREIGGGTGGTVSAADFYQQIRPYLRGDRRRVVKRDVNHGLYARWQEVLGVRPDQERLHWSSEDLRERVAAAFPGEHAGWQMARYHSPDVMVRTPSAEALSRGEYDLVLGEIHVARNTLLSSVFTAQHADSAELLSYVELDLPEPEVILIEEDDRDDPGRMHMPSCWERDHRIELVPRPFAAADPASVPLADLVVMESGEELLLASRDGRIRLDIGQLFGRFLSLTMMNGFRLLGREDHWPRVTIDRMIVQRESWTFEARGMEFAQLGRGSERFAAARRWARRRGVPRFVFVRVPTEKKPFYVDFESPVYVDLLAKAVRLTVQAEGVKPHVKMTEMLPRPDETFLVDAEGRRYTSELRIVVTDPVSVPWAGKR